MYITVNITVEKFLHYLVFFCFCPGIYVLYLENSTKMYFVLNEVKILRFIIFPWCETQLEQKTTCVEDNTLYHNADPDPALYFNEDSDSDTGPRLLAWTSKLQEVKNQ